MNFSSTNDKVTFAWPLFWPWLVSGWLIFLLLGLNGCHASFSPEKDKETVTLTLSTWGSAQELATLRQQLNRFEIAHPNIHVTVNHIPENYLAKLYLLAISNLLPDVMLMNSWQIPRFASHSLLQPLVPAPKDENNFYLTALQSLRYQSQLMALPRDVSMLVVLVNTDLLKRFRLPLPNNHWTLAEMEQLSQKMIRAQQNTKPSSMERIYPVSFYREPPLYWLPWVWGNGGGLWDSQGCLDIQSPKAAEALARYSRWTAQGYAPKRKDSARTTMTQLFLQQRLAFLLTGRWTVPLLREQATFNWTVWPLPAGSAGSKTGIDTTGYAIAKATPHPKEARLLVDFLTSTSVLTEQSKSGLLIAARPNVVQSTFSKEPRFLAVVTQSLQSGKPTEGHPNWPDVEAAISSSLEPYWDTMVTTKQLSQAFQPLHSRFCSRSQGAKQ